MLDILVMFGLFTIAAVWFLVRYNNVDSSEVESLRDRIAQLERDGKRTWETIDSAEKIARKSDERSLEASRAVDHFQEHLASVRESNIQVKNMLASKRPVIKFSEPVPVSIQTVPLAKKNSGTMKKVKKQLDGLSK